MIDRTKEQIIAFSKLKISEITKLKVDEIDENVEFFSLGLDSVYLAIFFLHCYLVTEQNLIQLIFILFKTW